MSVFEEYGAFKYIIATQHIIQITSCIDFFEYNLL